MFSLPITNFENNELRAFKRERKKKLAEKYFNIWKINAQQRKKYQLLENKSKLLDDKISTLVQKLNIKNCNKLQSKSKSSLLSLDNEYYKDEVRDARKPNKVGCFENRLIAQKEIIENQKALISQQVKVISELKSQQQLQRASKLVAAELEAVAERVGPPVKVIPVVEEHPVVRRMAAREEERRQQRTLLEMTRRERERAVAERLEREAAERREAAAAERREAARRRREEAQRRREEAERRDREAAFCRHLQQVAAAWSGQLSIARGLRGWLAVWQRERAAVARLRGWLKAVELSQHLWRWRGQSVLLRSNLGDVAQRLRDRALLRQVWQVWAQDSKRSSQIKVKVAKWRDAAAKRKCFNNWHTYTERNSRKKKEILTAVNVYYERRLTKRVLEQWAGMPSQLFERRERQKRLRRWEDAVRDLLPDYRPPLTTLAASQRTQ